MRIFLICLSFLCVATIARAETITLDSSKVVSLRLASKGINRITLTNDEIDNVFLAPSHLEGHVQLDASGHLFVTSDEVTHEAYLSLVTAGGMAQDFKLVFDARVPEPTFLRVPSQETQKDTSPMDLGAPDIASLLSRVRDGDVSGWRRTHACTNARKVGDLTATHEMSYIHETHPFVLYVYAMSGHGSFVPSAFQERGDLALVMNDKILTQNTKLFVIQERNSV